MTFYHVSLGWTEEYKRFVPRIPEFRAYGEDDVTKRICISDSISGCLSAIPDKPYRTDIWKEITVYKCEIENYIGFKELYWTGKVFDAYLTHECWYLEPIEMAGRHMLLRGFDSCYEFVPNEQRTDEYILYAVDYLKNHNVRITDEIKKRLYSCSMLEAMYDIFPQIFHEHDLDLDEVSEEILATTRIITNPELKMVVMD